MLKYIVRRLLILIPTLFVILVIAFMISRGVPGDPVNTEIDVAFRESSNSDSQLRQKEYARVSHEKGLDLPIFYLSLSAIAYPDTLHRILVLGERENLEEMVGTYGNWDEITAYYQNLNKVSDLIRHLTKPADQSYDILAAERAIEDLKTVATKAEITFQLELLDSLRSFVPLLRDSLANEIASVATKFKAVEDHASTWKLYVPTLHFYGFQNQFHHWLWRILQGDFGRSYSDHRNVGTMIKEALPWTMFMGFFSFVISYIIAIPVGVFAVRNRNQLKDRVLTISLFLLASIPSFVAAMLVMTFLCNQDYLQLFPTSGILSDGAELWPWPNRLLNHAYHLILPTMVFSYGSIAFLSRQMRAGMLETINLDYIRTARAKGLPEKTVIWKHAMRNSILPLVSQLSALLPSMVGGAVITETIFSIPGMGMLTIDAVGSFDHPVIIAVFTISSTATLIGLLLSDILMALVDPRISFAAK